MHDASACRRVNEFNPFSVIPVLVQLSLAMVANHRNFHSTDWLASMPIQIATIARKHSVCPLKFVLLYKCTPINLQILHRSLPDSSLMCEGAVVHNRFYMGTLHSHPNGNLKSQFRTVKEPSDAPNKSSRQNESTNGRIKVR